MPEGKSKEETQQEDQLLYEKYLKTTSKQAGMVFGTRVIGYLLGFAMQAVFARFLGADKYGLYSLGLTVANVGVLFGTFGLNAGMTRFLGEYLGKKDYSRAKGTVLSGFKFSIVLSSIPALIIFLLRKPIATNIFKDERLISILPWFSLILILLALMNLFRGILQGLKKPSIFTFYKEIIERALRIGIFIVLYVLGIEVFGAVVATLFSSLIVVLMVISWLLKKTDFITDKKIKPIQENRTLIYYSSNMLFVTFTYFLMGQVNRLIVGTFLESKQVGLYSISDTIARLSVFFLVAFNSIFQPIISELFHKNKLKMLSDLYSHITRWITTFTLPIIIWIIIFNKEILSIFGMEYVKANSVLTVLALGNFFNAFSGSCGEMLSMTNHQRLEMINGFIISAVNVILAFILIPKFGIIGAALSSTLAIVSANTIKIIEIYKLLKILPYNKLFLKLLFPTSITSIVMYSLHLFLSVNNLISVIIGILCSFVLFLAIFLICGVTKEDKFIIKKVADYFRR